MYGYGGQAVVGAFDPFSLDGPPVDEFGNPLPDGLQAPIPEPGTHAMLGLGLGACRTWVIESETAGERGRILTISTNVSGIREEKAAEYGPLSHSCSRIIPSPTGS
jgi:hypothetical protein